MRSRVLASVGADRFGTKSGVIKFKGRACYRFVAKDPRSPGTRAFCCAGARRGQSRVRALIRIFMALSVRFIRVAITAWDFPACNSARSVASSSGVQRRLMSVRAIQHYRIP